MDTSQHSVGLEPHELGGIDDMDNWVIVGDSSTILPQLPSESINAVITSPPYDNLRSYNGSTWNFDIFKTIAKELVRLLKQGGVIVWVVGDATIKGSETGSSFKQALHFKELGLNLHDTMIWEKQAPRYPAGKNSVRYGQNFEYMFIFSKGKPSTINLIRDKPNKYYGSGYWGKVSSFQQKDNKDIRIYRNKPELKVAEFGVRNNIWKINTNTTRKQCEKYLSQHPLHFRKV